MLPADQIRAEFARLLTQLPPRDWTAGEHAAFFNFFAHGWYGRAGEAAYQEESTPSQDRPLTPKEVEIVRTHL